MPTREKTYEAVLAILLGVLLLARIQGHAGWWWVALGLVLAALVALPLARGVAWAWLKLADLLGAFVSRVLLSVVYLLVLTPMALIQRLAGKNPLRTVAPDGGSSFVERGHRFEPKDLEKPW
ncbi:MAG: hypothetical protein JSS84_13035 [Bacteroidetes bacterium]|nr:hypothetical protein [Bacteroidota bacterium]